MTSHWWWRPGWRIGRSFYTWHRTFADDPDMAQLVDRYRGTLTRFDSLDVLRTDQLHLTIQGVGFTDEVTDSDVSAIVEATRLELASVATPTVAVGRPHVDRETVQVAISPVGAVAELRVALRCGIAAVWGAEHVPESMDGFRPHVTLAYSNSDHDRGEVERKVDQIEARSARFAVPTLSLIRLNRDNARYEWDEIVSLPVGAGAD